MRFNQVAAPTHAGVDSAAINASGDTVSDNYRQLPLNYAPETRFTVSNIEAQLLASSQTCTAGRGSRVPVEILDYGLHTPGPAAVGHTPSEGSSHQQ